MGILDRGRRRCELNAMMHAGEGTFATVDLAIWRASPTGEKRRVAVKKARDELSENEAALFFR